MRNLFIIILIGICSLASAQKPEPIKSFARVNKSVEYYREQIKLWKTETEKDAKNAFAWYNYYRATRNINRTNHADTRPFPERLKEEKNIVEQMEKVVPESFEYHLCKWMIGGNNFSDLTHIKKCEELGVGRVEHLSDLIVYAEITGDKNKRNKYALEWFNSDENSPGMMYYNYNVLSGLKENAILLTNGDNDTYPAWMLQAQGYRNDVLVLNTSLLNIQAYRDSIFKIIGVTLPKKTNIQGDSDLVKLITKNSKKIPVYLAVSINPECTKPIDENLYLTGLAYEYSENGIDNIAALRKNFEQNYLFDYISRPLFKDVSEYWTKLSNQNYIIPLIKLYEHYQSAGDIEHAKAAKKLALKIAEHTEKADEIISYFKNNKID
ncbi:MAG: hypothetical protein ACOVP1_08665 [Bacteroidia bacterium]